MAGTSPAMTQRDSQEHTIPRGLDHIVHTVHDLDAAGARYAKLGFTVGARNRHAWGTHNRIVQCPGTFIELLSVGDPELIPPSGRRAFSFGAFNRDFLAHDEGLSMLVLEGKGAAADAEAFLAAGIGDFEVFDFAREAKRPDGSAVKVAFSLVFAVDSKAPDAGYFTCQHHHPENFWNPAFQAHPNSVTTIAGAVLVAENPADHHVFLKTFSGVSDLKSTSNGITIETPRGQIQVMDPSAYQAHFAAAPPDVSRGARLAALRFSVRDVGALNSALERGGVAAIDHMGKRIVLPQTAFGATLAFEPVAC
jgi:hypothetical protein